MCFLSRQSDVVIEPNDQMSEAKQNTYSPARTFRQGTGPREPLQEL